MEERRVKQIEIFGRRFEVIKSSFKNACNECELYNYCHYIDDEFFMSEFCSKNLTHSECFKEIKD